MIVAICVVLGVVIAWSLVAGRVQAMRLTLPLVLMLAGVLVGAETSLPIFEHLDDPRLERAVELVLALLLFLDATEVRAWQRRDTGLLARLVLLAVPLSLLAAMVVAGELFPDMRLALCLVVACVVVPTDTAPASLVVKDPRIPRHVRDLLNVESGYNDAVVAPLFLFALALLAGGPASEDNALEALEEMLPATAWAVLIGAGVGALTALCFRGARRRGWTTPTWQARATLAIPLLSYALALGVHGNGFVAAFAAGLAHRAVLGPETHSTLGLAEDLVTLAQVALWFLFGQLLVLSLGVGIDPRAVVLGLLAVTVVRVVPVVLVLLRSSLTWQERWLVSWLGPRGIASIVFTLLAIPHLRDEDALLLLQVLGITVLSSVVLHGVSAPWIAGRLTRPAAQQDAPAAASAAG